MKSVKQLGFAAIILATSIQTALASSYTYLASVGDSNVSVVNMDAQINIANIPLSSNNSNPNSWYWGYGYQYGVRQAIIANRDGTKLYAAGRDSISIISTKTNLVETSISLDSGAHSVVISPDQTTLYVSNYEANTVTVIDLLQNVATRTIQLGNELYGYSGGGIAIDPNGTYLYVNAQGRDTSTTPATNKHVLKKVNLTSPNFTVTTLDLTSNTASWFYNGGGITTVGNKVFISSSYYSSSNSYQHVVYEVDGNTMGLVSTISTPVNMYGWYGGGDVLADQAGHVFFTSQGYDSTLNSNVHRLYTIDTQNNNSLSYVDLSSGESWYGYQSGALALNQADGELYITQAFRVHIYDIASGTLKGHMGAGATPMSIVYIPNVQPLSVEDCSGQHAVFTPETRTLSIPRIAIPLLDPINGRPTGQIGVFKGDLDLIRGIEDFQTNPSQFRFIEMASNYQPCDARYSYVNPDGSASGGSLHIPLADVPSIITLPGGFVIPGPTNVFEVILRTLATDESVLHVTKYYYIGQLPVQPLAGP